jgi:uncharacterized protein YggE
MQSKSPFIITFFGILILAMISAGVYIMWDSTRPLSSITVQEQVTKTIKPDKATIDLTISEKTNDIRMVKSKVDAQTKSVIDFLIKEGISKDKITTNTNTYPDYTASGNPTDVQKTVLDSTLTVVFERIQEDTQKPNRILNTSIEMGVSRFSQFRYDFSSTKDNCQQLRDDADKKSLERAREKVSLLGGKLTKVELQSSNDGNCGGNIYYGGPIAMSSSISERTGGANTPELLSGEKELSATSIAKADYKL